MIHVRFEGRQIMTDGTFLGNECDHLAEQMVFDLPQIFPEGQTAYVCCRRADEAAEAVLLAESGVWTVPGSVTRIPGAVSLYLRLVSESGAVWNSNAARFIVRGQFPVTDQEVLPQDPSLLEDALAQIGQCALSAREDRQRAESVWEDLKELSDYPPYVNGDGAWRIWDFESNAYVDTGVSAVGPKGEDAAGITVTAFVENAAALSGIVPSPGMACGVGRAAPYDIYLWDDANDRWVNTGPLQGVKGDKGDKGDRGDPGPVGAKGDKGDTGEAPDNVILWTRDEITSIEAEPFFTLDGLESSLRALIVADVLDALPDGDEVSY